MIFCIEIEKEKQGGRPMIGSLGFTGTRRGMTDAQKTAVTVLLHLTRPKRVHHGDCKGADAEFHDLVREHLPPTTIVAHPCDLGDQRAHCDADFVLQPLPPLNRNRSIVYDGWDGLIATPSGFKEQVRSGTWSTIRRARDLRRVVVIVWPDGRISGVEDLSYPRGTVEYTQQKTPQKPP